ncbi:MAG: TaqI-like C-terminal specificity domain-containing protein [Bacteroidales bacterium]|nr:TaqI-like C-terminal specificity domain-containing protein [Bacteroidales bacterium]
MELKALKPRKSLNKAFLKLKPNRSDIETFKSNLIELLDRLNPNESEEFHKNLISEFLRKTYYRQSENFINTKGRNDLVIYNGKDSKSTVGVIIEAKKSSNKTEMLSLENINVKAFHELILYYLRERISEKNLDIKHIIATNINEWFVFEVNVFEKLFANNKNLVKQFTDFEEGRLSGKTTDFFYSEIAKPFVENVKSEIVFTYFDLREYEKPLRNDDKRDDTKLVALFKLFSPEHLLKLPFVNDSNSLDKRFYSELLHIIGLTETKQGSKKLIERKPENERNSGSLIENAIIQLDSLDKINRLENPRQYGETMKERLFSVGLELSITWINRILFLKLLEAQLIKYHKGNKDYSVLNLKKIQNYDDLNTLFFQVLAKQYNDRNEDVKKEFDKVPFLNSSLFEPTEIEHTTLLISNLRDDKKLPILSSTVLKDNTGKKRTGELTTLEYLFEFLDSYDFSSEGAEDIQEDNKTLINASVLGLIFEKINGYKDGSFFTPGFITMYMCRETIRRAVLQKFNETKGWNCENLDSIYDKIENRQEANDIVNSIKICDPAVGSGHFLVSALNEIIAVKNDLKILQDRDGKRLKEYQIEVVNDELIVTDEDGELFEYNPSSKESQRVQETLFHEKQTIIESCLFGVDINPNSVKICRLRLWIELLKNAYYKSETELETLPNIDINIKCGNSLVSRFSLDSDLKQALKNSKWSIDMYRIAVQTYRNAENKEQKHEMEKLIKTIKTDFRSEIAANSKEIKELSKWKGELDNLVNQTTITLFEKTAKEKKEFDEKAKKLTEKIKKQENLIKEIKNNKIYENAFEWRFEFPEVLNDDGEFVGFDVVIGNPPYIDIKGLNSEQAKYYFRAYPTASNRINLYSIFVELSHNILKKNGNFTFIIPNSILVNSSYQAIRNLIFNDVNSIIKLPEKVFPDAIVETIIISFTKELKSNNVSVIRYQKDEHIDEIDNNLIYKINKEIWCLFENLKFNIYLNNDIQQIIKKCHTDVAILGEIADFTLGITPYDKYKGHTQELIKNREFHSDKKNDETYKPIISGSNIIQFKIKDEIKEYIKYGEWLGAPREERFFTDSRVIVRQIVSGQPPRIFAGYTDKPYYFTQIGFSIIPRETVSPKVLTALLNSSLINFIHKYLYLDIEKELFQKILIENAKKIPIKSMTTEQTIQIENIVDRIIMDEIALENGLEIIDSVVYELYGLSEEEVLLITEIK